MKMFDAQYCSYLSVCFYMYVSLAVGYFGGEAALVEHLVGVRVRTSVPPCCCCCCCILKPRQLTKYVEAGAQLAYKECGFKIIQGVRGHAPPENFEINGAIWCVLGPPESFLDQPKSIYFSIKMEMNSLIKILRYGVRFRLYDL